MAENMIERVARALFKEEWNDKSSEPWEGAAEDEREAWLKSARVAIEAMREPTTEMRDAMNEDIDWDGDAVRAYRAGIDAALEWKP